MSNLSVIILSNTLDEEIYQMNQSCLSSLFESENWLALGGLEVLLIESNRDNTFVYQQEVKVIQPTEAFNFHRYLNLGISQSSGHFVALCNNDIVFSKNWFSEMLKVKQQHPEFSCFCPIDRDYKTMSYELFPESKDFYIGWDNKYHFAAWCFVWERKVFEVIGKLDEAFDFYSADDDELMCLRKYAIDNVLVTKSQVKHLSQQVTKKVDEQVSPKITDKKKYPLSEKQLAKGLDWLWSDIRFYEAYFKLEAKWGNTRMIERINRLLTKFPILRRRCLTKILYDKRINFILSKLSGI